MGRRRNDDWVEMVAKLVGLLIMLSLLSPAVRNFLSVLSTILISLAILSVVGLIGFLIYKRHKSNNAFGENLKLDTITPVNLPNHLQLPAVLTRDNLLEHLYTIDWFQFEKLVGYIYERMGFLVTRRGGANPDGGIDLLVERDGQSMAIQCKQWKTRDIGVKPMREFLGALTDAHIQRGIFITLNGYTGEAKQLADKHGIEIINATGMAEMLQILSMDDPKIMEVLNDTRKFCPKCEREMVLRTAKRGPNPGQEFWGCSGYPRCKYNMPC